MADFVLIRKQLKECLTMFGVIVLTQIVNMEFIQTNKNRNCSSLKAIAIFDTDNLQMALLYYNMQWQTQATQWTKQRYHSS